MAEQMYPNFISTLRDELEGIREIYHCDLYDYMETQSEEDKDIDFVNLALHGRWIDTELTPQVIDAVDRSEEYLPPETRCEAFQVYSDWKSEINEDLKAANLVTRGLALDLNNPDNLAYTLADKNQKRILVLGVDGSIASPDSSLEALAKDMEKTYVDPMMGDRFALARSLDRAYELDKQQADDIRRAAAFDAADELLQNFDAKEASLPDFA